MRSEDIKKVVLDLKEAKSASVSMLDGVIPGATVYYHNMLAGEQVQFMADTSFIRIFFLCVGAVTFQSEGQEYAYDEKAVFANKPEKTVEILANSNAQVVEIRWEMNADDLQELAETEFDFPITEKYVDAPQYRDPFKSEKTISRAIVKQRVIPRFAMGSVETHGDDLIGQHEHPLLDQFFWSFSENDCDLLIDDLVYPMYGDTFLYIPLGSNHGVKTAGKQIAHYIWLDFIQDPEAANAYLDEVHKPTGVKESF